MLRPDGDAPHLESKLVARHHAGPLRPWPSRSHQNSTVLFACKW